MGEGGKSIQMRLELLVRAAKLGSGRGMQHWPGAGPHEGQGGQHCRVSAVQWGRAGSAGAAEEEEEEMAG